VSRLRRVAASASQGRCRRVAASASRGRCRRVAALAILLMLPVPAAAQQYSPAPHPGFFEISGGVIWTGGYDAGSGDANLSPNSTTGAPPVTLFTSSAHVSSAAGIEARFGMYLGSNISAEGTFQFSRPTLRVDLDDDFETATAVEAAGRVSSYVFSGSVLYHFGSGRVLPFVIGGAGYLRQLDEDNTNVLSGSEIHGGGGVKIWFGSGGRFGVRADARVSARSKSAGFEDKRRILPVLGAGAVYRF
jgi:hypothetical protein